MKIKKYSNIGFWITLLTSICLIVVGFILPPTGQIDGSVLTAVGELLAFGAIAQIPDVIHHGSDISVKKGDLEVSINNPDTDVDIKEQ